MSKDESRIFYYASSTKNYETVLTNILRTGMLYATAIHTQDLHNILTLYKNSPHSILIKSNLCKEEISCSKLMLKFPPPVFEGYSYHRVSDFIQLLIKNFRKFLIVCLRIMRGSNDGDFKIMVERLASFPMQSCTVMKLSLILVSCYVFLRQNRWET